MPFFESLKLLPDDPIVHLPILFAADKRPNKVNLGVGSYKDSEGMPMPLVCVRQAEQNILASQKNKEYLPIEGGKAFIRANTALVMGSQFLDTPAHIASFGIQAIGGTGALRIGGEFLAQLPAPKIYIPSPTWPNHNLTFTRSGLHVESYRYYDAKTFTLDFQALCDDITQMPPSSAILLHGCCHNPSGIDPSQEQWKELSALIKSRRLIPFFDLAYQGFAKDLDADAWAVRYFAEQGHEMLVANSFSKNLGLYGERVGGLLILTKDQSAANAAGSHIKQLIRGSYSTPPLHGMEIVTEILNSQNLYADWIGELANMRLRLDQMRYTLMSGLETAAPQGNWTHLLRQKGFFSFLGLTKDQVEQLNREYAIFMPASGRINVAGLNGHNMEYVIQAIAAVYHS